MENQFGNSQPSTKEIEEMMTEEQKEKSEERDSTFKAGENAIRHNILEKKVTDLKSILEGQYYYRNYTFVLKNNESFSLQGKFTVKGDRVICVAEGYGASEIINNKTISIAEIVKVIENIPGTQDRFQGVRPSRDEVVFIDNSLTN